MGLTGCGDDESDAPDDGGASAEPAADGVRSLAVDLCGYGGSECADGEQTPPAEPVDLAAAHARDAMGAERVVLVGASRRRGAPGVRPVGRLNG